MISVLQIVENIGGRNLVIPSTKDSRQFNVKQEWLVYYKVLFRHFIEQRLRFVVPVFVEINQKIRKNRGQ